MKKIIILLLVSLLCGCSAEKPSETLSSMQRESTAETNITETVAPEETAETAPKETEPVIETPKTETTMPSVGECPEQKPTTNTSTETIVEIPVEPINAETTTKPTATPKAPTGTVKEDKPTDLLETSKRRLRALQSHRKRSLMSTTGSTLRGPTRSKSGLKLTKRRWTVGTTRQLPMPIAFTLSEI